MVTAKNKQYLIGKWLQGLLSGLTWTDSNKKVFKKVLLGYDETKIKTFGDGILCTVYVTGSDYQETFGIHNRPVFVKSNIAFTIKGTTEAKYDLAIKALDLLQEELETNHDWQRLIHQDTNKRVVRDTDVLRSTLTLAPVGKRLDIIGLIELQHHVFK